MVRIASVDQFQGDPFVFFGQVKPFLLQIGQKTTFGLDIGVRNLVPTYRYFTCNLTYSCHDDSKILVPKNSGGKGRETQLITESKIRFFSKITGKAGQVS